MKGQMEKKHRCAVCGLDIPDGNYAPSFAKKGVFEDRKGREWRIQVSKMLTTDENGGRKPGFYLLPICDGCLNDILDFINSKNPEI